MENKYYITYGHYYDCPSCDSSSSNETEGVYLSKQLDNIPQIVQFIKDNFNSMEFLAIYSILPYGKLKLRSLMDTKTNFHSVYSVKFYLNKNHYTVYKNKIESTDKTFNTLYGS